VDVVAGARRGGHNQDRLCCFLRPQDIGPRKVDPGCGPVSKTSGLAPKKTGLCLKKIGDNCFGAGQSLKKHGGLDSDVGGWPIVLGIRATGAGKCPVSFDFPVQCLDL